MEKTRLNNARKTRACAEGAASLSQRRMAVSNAQMPIGDSLFLTANRC